MNILFLTTILPSQQKMGSEVASQAFIDALTQAGHKTSVVGYMRKDDVFELTAGDFGVEEILVDRRYIETKRSKTSLIKWLGLSFFLDLPYSAAKYYSKAYVRIVKTLLESQPYDVVIIDHPQMGWISSLIKNRTKLIGIAHNIEREIYLDHSQTATNWIFRWIYEREARLIQRLEDSLALEADELWALTDHDAQYFSQLQGARQVRTFDLPPGIDQRAQVPDPKVCDVGLIGSWNWKFNEQGLQWFLNQIYPQLPSDISIHIAGKGADWLTGKYPNIRYQGFVPDAQQFMAQAKVVAIPTLGGGGIQIKTLDALASGSRIVATHQALRGISEIPQTVQIAETAHDFARYLVESPSTEPVDEVRRIASDWLTARQSKFITDIQSSIRQLN